jgi:hypothetical protein
MDSGESDFRRRAKSIRNFLDASDVCFVAPLCLLVLALSIWRQAYRVSAEHGYPFWSLATLREMTGFLIVIGLSYVAITAWIAIRWHRERKNAPSQPEAHSPDDSL